MLPKTGISLDHYGISLREEKYAKTKIAILNLVLEKLEKTTFDQINIADICKEIGVSKRTFFNYFNSIYYVFFYLLQIWIVDTMIITTERHPVAGLKSIETAFEELGKKIAKQPKAAFQIFSSIFSADVEMTKMGRFTKAEAILWGFDSMMPEDMPVLGFQKMLIRATENAKTAGELPGNIDLTTIETSLNSILIGVPFTLKDVGFMDISAAYKRQLDILWHGLNNIK
jgi:AcrR family transcriptional regulator